MNIKRLCLIAGLLGLPVAYTNAGEITINVPVELTNVPAANRNINIDCDVGVGPPSTVALASWPISAIIGQGANTIEVPSSGRLVSRTSIVIAAYSARSLDDATHYKCRLSGIAGQPALAGSNEVSGAIPR